MSVVHVVSGYAGVSSAPALDIAVEDDDAPGLSFAPAAGLSLAEGGAATGTYTAVLTAQPTGAVTVAVSSDDAGVEFDADDGTPSDQSSVAFDQTNWDVPRTIEVRSVADGDAASEEAALLYAATGGGYGGATAEYEVRVSDADAAGGHRGAVGAHRRAAAGAALRSAGAGSEPRRSGGSVGHGGGRADATAVGGVGAPEVANAPGALVLEAGGSAEIDLAEVFRDPDGDPLTYAASSSDGDVAAVRVEAGVLLVGAGRPGSAKVSLSATDPGGLSARTTVDVDVVGTLCATEVAQAPEGGVAVATAELRWRLASVGREGINRRAPRLVARPQCVQFRCPRQRPLRPLGWPIERCVQKVARRSACRYSSRRFLSPLRLVA